VAAAGRDRGPGGSVFLRNLETQVFQLRAGLVSGTYRPGPYRVFHIQDPKPREISAALFRDRVVHHAVTALLEPLFERRFAAESFACRRGKGTHAALDHARRACRRFPYVLKCDVAKYFSSIDHDLLMARLATVVRCARTLELVRAIVSGFASTIAEQPRPFPGDTLLTALDRRVGLPLGNQTSQFFANVYLDPLDQFIKRRLRPGAYARYVDDFLLFDTSRARLEDHRAAMIQRLETLRLRLHDRKCRVYRSTDGVTFLGWRLFRNRTRLLRPNVVRARLRRRAAADAVAAGRLAMVAARAAVHAWNGHAMWGDTWRLREQMFRTIVFRQRSGA